jgi:hypothetical protein
MMSENRKKFVAKHSKSSAALVSLGVHAVLIVVAVSFVAVTVINKEDQTFEQVEVRRPKVPLKKLQVPVKIKKKKTPKPKLRKTIVVKKEVQMAELKMPEMSGIKGGTGYMDGDGGLGSLGFGLDIDLFGGNKGSGNELEGTFFDLKMNPDGTPNEMKHTSDDMKKESRQNKAYIEAVDNFLGSWNVSRLEKRYFKAPKSKFATTFMLPRMDAEEAPKAYKVEDVVKPKRWVAYYFGKIAAPETGRYRFWGAADDLLIVRIKKRLVLDGSRQGTIITDWKSDDPRSGKMIISNEKIKIGDWIHLTKGQPVDMEVLVGEKPGGLFNCSLLIEQDGVSYAKGKKGLPILPIFKTTEIPEKLIPQMKIDEQVCTPEGPVFGVLK